jgi:hypothetical protein
MRLELPGSGIADRVRGAHQGCYHDNGNRDDGRSLAGVGALASCVRLDHAGHSKHPRQIARLA